MEKTFQIVFAPSSTQRAVLSLLACVSAEDHRHRALGTDRSLAVTLLLIPVMLISAVEQQVTHSSHFGDFFSGLVWLVWILT